MRNYHTLCSIIQLRITQQVCKRMPKSGHLLCSFSAVNFYGESSSEETQGYSSDVFSLNTHEPTQKVAGEETKEAATMLRTVALPTRSPAWAHSANGEFATRPDKIKSAQWGRIEGSKWDSTRSLWYSQVLNVQWQLPLLAHFYLLKSCAMQNTVFAVEHTSFGLLCTTCTMELAFLRNPKAAWKAKHKTCTNNAWAQEDLAISCVSNVVIPHLLWSIP